MQKLRIGYIMKKYFVNLFLKLNIVLVIAVCFFAGCTDVNEFGGDKINVVAVNFAQYDFARAVCHDIADVKMIIRPGAEVHSYEPSLSDIMTIENADVFIYGGGESDKWIDRILSSVDTKDMTVIQTMDLKNVHLYEEEKHTTHNEHDHYNGEHEHHNEEHDHHHDEGAPAYDEHIWTSPKNAKAIVDAIKNAMVQKDSQNKDIYEKNAREYIYRLNELDAEFTELLQNSKNKFIAVADRFPFLYLANDYGLEYMAAFSGCSPESDAGPSVIANMTEEIRMHGTNVVFYIELSNEKMADAICEITGAKKMLLHSCQSISRADFEAGVTYAELMKNNLTNLKEALRK